MTNQHSEMNPCCTASRESELPLLVTSKTKSVQSQQKLTITKNMVSIEGGTYLMGTDYEFGFPADGEGPIQQVKLDRFLIDSTTVTNRNFADFVKETKYKTDAEKFAEEDKKKKETVDIKNEAESFIYTTEKLVNQDLKDKIPQEKGIKITDAIKDLKESLTQETEQIKPKLDALKAIVNEVTTELYKNATPPPGGEQQSNQEQDNSSDQPTDEQKSNSEDNEEKAEPNSDQKSENS